MDKAELSIGLLRNKLREFGDIDYTLDNKITEAYVFEPEAQIEEIKDKLERKSSKIKRYQRLLSLYEKLRFLNFVYYLAPFALIFGIIALLLANRGALLLLFSFIAMAKFALGKSIALRIRHQEYLMKVLEQELSILKAELEKRKDEREALLARAGILAAEIRYLEHYLKDAS